MPPVIGAPGYVAPTPVDGERGITGVTTQRIPLQVDDRILFRRPNASPVVTFTKAIRGKKTVTNREFGWFFQDLFPRQSSVADATLDTVATTLNVAAGEGKRFHKNAVVLNADTREVFRVSAVATDALTIVRLQNPKNMVQGNRLLILGSAYEDAANKGTLKNVAESYNSNYTQTVRTPWGFSRRQKHTDLYGGRDPKVIKEQKTTEHAIDMEQIALFGRKFKRSVTNSQGTFEETYSGGLEYFLDSGNVWDLQGDTPSLGDFNKALEIYMSEGDGGYINSKGDAKKYLIHGPAWGTLFDSWFADRIQYRIADQAIQIRVGFIETSHGVIGLLRHPLLMGVNAGMAFLLDFNHIEFKVHEGGDTVLREEIQAPDVDGEEHEFLTDFGLKVENTPAHAIFRNLPANA